MCGTLQHPLMEAKSPKVSRRRFSRESWADKSFPSDFHLFSPTVHHYVLAASVTGPVMHCAIWGLRHKLDQEQHRTVCAGPARARFGSIAWPSDSFLGVGRKDQGPVIAPRLASICCISTYSQSHDCRRPIALWSLICDLLLDACLAMCFSASSCSSQPSWASHRVSKRRKYCSHPSSEASSQLCRELIFPDRQSGLSSYPQQTLPFHTCKLRSGAHSRQHGRSRPHKIRGLGQVGAACKAHPLTRALQAPSTGPALASGRVTP